MASKFHGECGCGFVSPPRDTRSERDADMIEHQNSAHRRPGWTGFETFSR